MDPTLVALINPAWNSLAAGQNAVILGIMIASFANIVVLFNMARLIFVHHEYDINMM